MEQDSESYDYDKAAPWEIKMLKRLFLVAACVAIIDFPLLQVDIHLLTILMMFLGGPMFLWIWVEIIFLGERGAVIRNAMTALEEAPPQSVRELFTNREFRYTSSAIVLLLHCSLAAGAQDSNQMYWLVIGLPEIMLLTWVIFVIFRDLPPRLFFLTLGVIYVPLVLFQAICTAISGYPGYFGLSTLFSASYFMLIMGPPLISFFLYRLSMRLKLWNFKRSIILLCFVVSLIVPINAFNLLYDIVLSITGFKLH